MRFAAVALFLGAGPAALCQSSAPVPLDIGRLDQNRFSAVQSTKDLSKSFAHAQQLTLLQAFTMPIKPSARWSEDARVDPKMVVHPPPASIGLQPPGTVIAQNEFPNLRILPIESPESKIAALPSQWPNLKVQGIPTRWPKLEMSPNLGAASATLQPAAK